MAGRPRLDFNWDIVDALITTGASERYIAEYLLKNEGTSPTDIGFKMVQAKVKLLQRRIEERWGCNFVQYRDQKQESMKLKLTELQWDAAKAGKVAMLIWLGKQYLGQTDKIQQHNIGDNELVQIYIPKNESESLNEQAIN